MSDQPTLYQIDKTQLDGVFYEGGHWAIMADEAIEMLVDRCVLVPLEPCEHGNTGEHVIDGSMTVDVNHNGVPVLGFERCAGIGGDDAGT